MRTPPLNLVFLLILFTSSPVQAQQAKKQVAVPFLEVPTALEKSVNRLSIEIPYNSLRFGPYGWVHTGRWEFGVNLMPWLSSTNDFVSIFTEDASQSLGTVSLLEGVQDLPQLYVKGYEVIEVPERPGIIVFQADFARQFGSGWRTGIGIAILRSVNPRPTTLKDVTQLIAPEEYVAFSNFSSKAIFYSGHLGYTFRRNKRFRPALGLVGIIPGKYILSSDYKVIAVENGQMVYESSSKESEDLGQVKFYLMGQIGFQYQIYRHFSIGIEAAVPISTGSNGEIPLIGIGGRYSFARQW